MGNINIVKYCMNMEKELLRSIAKRRAFLAKCPDGQLECYKNGCYFTWYKVDRVKLGENTRKKRTLISKKNAATAERLAAKGYNQDALRTELKQLKAVQLFLKYYPREAPGQKYAERNEEYMRLSAITNIKFKYTSAELNWMNQPRPVPQEWLGELNVPTIMDFMVRSKSEAEYVSKFVELGIVFRYEWPTEIKGYSRPIFPDFRILDTHTGNEYIIEHFGRMDDPDYVAKNADKLEKYLSNGWLPGENLFISYETKDAPFTSADAEEIIRKNFPHLIKD